MLGYIIGAFINVSLNIAAWTQECRINIALTFIVVLLLVAPYALMDGKCDEQSEYLSEVDKRIEELKKTNSDGAK